MRIAPFSTDRFRVEHWGACLRQPECRRGLEAQLSAILTPSVLHHLPPGFRTGRDPAAIATWIDARSAQSDVLTVHALSDDALTGLVILAEEPGSGPPPLVHLGYLLAEAAWGRGVATEIVRGVVGALDRAGPTRLQAGVSADNPASARVLVKAGFTPRPALPAGDMETYEREVG